MLSDLNKSLCQRLDSIESKLRTLDERTKYVESQMADILQKPCTYSTRAEWVALLYHPVTLQWCRVSCVYPVTLQWCRVSCVIVPPCYTPMVQSELRYCTTLLHSNGAEWAALLYHPVTLQWCRVSGVIVPPCYTPMMQSELRYCTTLLHSNGAEWVALLYHPVTLQWCRVSCVYPVTLQWCRVSCVIVPPCYTPMMLVIK